LIAKAGGKEPWFNAPVKRLAQEDFNNLGEGILACLSLKKSKKSLI
jgi:hypothetical protein